MQRSEYIDYKNKIICADSYKFLKSLDADSVDCIYTDIPYELTCTNNTKPFLSQIKDFANGTDFTILNEFVRVLKKINLFIWCSTNQIYPILDYFHELNCHVNILVWCKTNPVPFCHNCWLSDVEYCLHIRESKVCLNKGYHHKQKFFVSSTNMTDKRKYGHPTIKPLEFVMNHLKHATQVGDLILDPFCGSGTTCVAAKKLGRNYLGIELEKKFCDLSELRLSEIQLDGKPSQ